MGVVVVITATARAPDLSSICDEWRVVAIREPFGTCDVWTYTLPAHEIAKFKDHVAHGDIIAPQRREPDGSLVMLAKLASVR